MRIDFGTFSQSDASILINDKTELSLLIAEKFLSNIPSRITENNSIPNLEFEIASEGFLLFMISARDSILQEINNKLNLGFAEDQVSLKCILEKLASRRYRNDARCQSILKLLQGCVSEPEKVIDPSDIRISTWDRTNSWLWEIEEMRNKIGHRSIINRQIISGQTAETKMIVCEISKQPIIRTSGTTTIVPIPNPKIERLLEDNPSLYFASCHHKLVMLKKEVRGVLV